MSIWCSWREIGWERFTNWARRAEGGEVRTYANGWSNHYPTTDGKVERKANVSIDSMPMWCVPGHREEMGDDFGPWLRLNVYTAEHDFYHPRKLLGGYDLASVVMDEGAVQALVDDLSEWLARPKVQPMEETP